MEESKAQSKLTSEADSSEQQKTSSSAEEQAKAQEEGKTKEERGEESGEEKEKEKEKKEDPPPPPPHGDKSPWQVFMETMQSELKQSKEWNDSTKALASSAHQFTESESVRKARQAYDATTGAVSNTASTVT